MVLDRYLQDSNCNQWSCAIDYERFTAIADVLDFRFHFEPPHPEPLKIAGVGVQFRFIGIVQFGQ